MTNAIPKASIDKLEEVLAGYNKTAEVGEPIDDAEIANVRDVSQDVARRQKMFFAEFNVLEKDGHDYTLTEKGNTLGKNIRFNQTDEAAEIFGELLQDWEPTAEILGYFDEEGLTENELANKIALATATELTNWRKEAGASALIVMFQRAGLIREDGERYYRNDTQETSAEVVPSESKSQIQTQEVEQPAPSVEPNSAGSSIAQTGGVQAQAGGIDISLDISGGDDPENVRQLLLAIRQGAEADVNEYEANGE